MNTINNAQKTRVTYGQACKLNSMGYKSPTNAYYENRCNEITFHISEQYERWIVNPNDAPYMNLVSAPTKQEAIKYLEDKKEEIQMVIDSISKIEN